MKPRSRKGRFKVRRTAPGASPGTIVLDPYAPRFASQIIATNFIPLGRAAGAYGMDFEAMPELEWRFGYPLVLAIMALIAAFLILMFWRRGWLTRT